MRLNLSVTLKSEQEKDDTHRTKLQKLLCLKYFGRTLAANSAGLKTVKAFPSSVQAAKGAT